MNTADFERARSQEMRRILRERQQRPSHLMTYGDDWPPPPPPPAARKRPPLTLWQKALADVVIFALIWAGGEVAILIVQAAHH